MKQNQINDRLERLEIANEVTQHNFSFLVELINTINSFSFGKLLINKARNRQRLTKLKYNVLPRRQRQLVQILRDDIPKSIKETFIKDEMSLIKSATNSIRHREIYDKKISQTIASSMKG
jgi:hypothetical protein